MVSGCLVEWCQRGWRGGSDDVVVAERGGDYLGGHVELVLAGRGSAASGRRDAELVHQRRQAAGRVRYRPSRPAEVRRGRHFTRTAS